MRRLCSSRALTSSRSARSPPRCARCARRSPTRAREFATRARTYAGRLATEPNGSPDEAPSPRAPPPARPRQAPRHGRAAAPRRLPLEQGDRGAARRRRRRQDAGGRELAAPEEVVQGQQDPAGGRGRQAAGGECKAGKRRDRRLRPRRLPVSRTREGARRGRTRRRLEVLSTTPVEREVIERERERELKERVVEINRVAKVVKGGRRFSFTALVVIGDEVDRVGVGYGKAREVPLAISKAVDDAKKNLFTVPKHGTTITHEIIGRADAARVLLRPASEGTGVIAGGGVRAILELAGIRDILAKSLGTTNPINMLKAAEQALRQLRRPEDVAKARGLTISQVLPYKRPEPEEGPAEEPAPVAAEAPVEETAADEAPAEEST